MLPMDVACVDLCKAMNSLPGITTTGSCCGHGKSPYRVWFGMDCNSVGAIVMARCVSGRYYCYAEGELRSDPEWRVQLADTDAEVSFELIGKVMTDDEGLHPPAEKLVKNLNEYFSLAERSRRKGDDPAQRGRLYD